jgi:hypothetical protein
VIENSLPALKARPSALHDADERRHHAHAQTMRSIELFGTKVAPAVRKEVARRLEA